MLGFHKLDRHKVSKTGDCRKLLGQPYGRNASSMTRIWGSMFTLMGCSLAGLKMSLRTGFCCRNFLAPAAPYLDSKYVTKNFAPIALWQEQYLGGRGFAVKIFWRLRRDTWTASMLPKTLPQYRSGRSSTWKRKHGFARSYLLHIPKR